MQKSDAIICTAFSLNIKSNSVSRVLYLTVIYLGLMLPKGSSPLSGMSSRLLFPSGCSGWGLHGNSVTIIPVRSYRTFPQSPEKFRHLFSVALSLESLPPAVSRHPCSMEPGLSSRTNCARNRLNYSDFNLYTLTAHNL